MTLNPHPFDKLRAGLPFPRQGGGNYETTPSFNKVLASEKAVRKFSTSSGNMITDDLLNVPSSARVLSAIIINLLLFLASRTSKKYVRLPALIIFVYILIFSLILF